MAVTSFATGNALTVKKWQDKLNAEVQKQLVLSPLMGPSSKYAVQVFDEMSKSAGDLVNYGLRMQHSGALKSGDSTLTGNERSQTIHSDSFSLGLNRDAVAWDSVMSQQRTTFDLREEAVAGLGDLVADAIERSMFNHLAGASYETDNSLRGNNSITINDSGYHIYGGGATSVSDIDSTDTFDVTVLDKAVRLAKLATPAIRPAWIPFLGKSMYVCIIHPYQAEQLRGTSTQWENIQLAAMQGGRVDDNPLVTGYLGVYNGVLLLESSRIPRGSNAGTETSDTRSAVFLGAQALACGWGRSEHGTPQRYKWVEEVRDYEKTQGVAAQFVWGCKRPRFNSSDVFSITISSYSNASDDA